MYTQPALFAVEYALARLWMSWGVRPTALLGHSLGEYVAACLAGVFSLDDALKLVAARGRLMQQTDEGAMLSVPLSVEALVPWLDHELELAAENAPELCVVSGAVAAIERLEAALAARGIEGRRLPTTRAFHSRLMEAALEPFAAEVAHVALHPPAIPFVSNVSGSWITAEQATDPGYWVRQLRAPVRFGPGVAELVREGKAVLLEVGPGRTLSSLARQQAGAERVVLASLGRAEERAALPTALGRLWLAGVPLDWAGLHAGAARRRVLLPTYPFERQRYWIEYQGMPSQQGMVRKHTDPADWFSVPSWKRSMAPLPFEPGDLAEEPASWLVFQDTLGLGAQLTQRLESEGHQIIAVSAGDHWEQLGPQRYTLDPRRPEHYQALLRELHTLERPLRSVVHLWSVTAAPASLDTSLDLGFYSLLFFAQALGNQGLTQPLNLLVISNDAQTVSNEPLQPEKTPIFGPCKVIPQEYPHIRCRSVDIVLPEAEDQAQLADQLLAEVAAPALDPVVAYRGPHRWVQSYEPVRLDAATRGRARLRERGVYLITGGLGDIGLALAEELAREVRARLILIGRTAMPTREDWAGWLAAHPDDDPTSRRIRHVQAIEAHGAEVLALPADVADEAQMRAVLAQATARFGTIHGVIHAAGVAGGGMIQLKTPELAERVLAPKLRGTAILEAIFGDTKLDFLALCSSVSALTGGVGQVDYCAANIFLDAFALARSAGRGTHILSINWDRWRNVGMARIAEELHRSLTGTELADGLPTEQAAVAFRRALTSSTSPQIAVTLYDLPAIVEQMVASSVSQLLEGIGHAQVARTVHSRPALGTAHVPPRQPTETLLVDVWQELLGFEPVGIHDNFFEAGGHSLLATQVLSRVRDALHVQLPLHAIFDAPTVAELAAVIDQVRQEQQESSKLDQILREIEAISADDARAILSHEMGQEAERSGS